MNKDEFDGIIKEQIIEKYGEGYLHWDTDHDKYYRKNDFEMFIEEMRSGFPCVYQEYSAGNGFNM